MAILSLNSFCEHFYFSKQLPNKFDLKLLAQIPKPLMFKILKSFIFLFKVVRTYLEALRLVKEGHVDIALIDYNVAAWLQEDIIEDDLRITKIVKQNFHKHIYIYEVRCPGLNLVHTLRCQINEEGGGGGGGGNFRGL